MLVYISISPPLVQSFLSEQIGRVSWEKASQQKEQAQTGKAEVTVKCISRLFLEVGYFANIVNEASL